MAGKAGEKGRQESVPWGPKIDQKGEVRKR